MFALSFASVVFFVLFDFISECFDGVAQLRVVLCDLIVLLKKDLIFSVFRVDLALKTGYKLKQQPILIL